jgi:hypothetical protein
MILARETVWLAIIGVADMIFTAILISTGWFTEANPLLAFYLRYGIAAMCLAKLFLTLVPLAVAEVYRRQKPALIQSMLRAAILLYLFGYVAAVSSANARYLF